MSVTHPRVDLVAWRRDRLLEVGFPAPLARALAADGRWDLHALIELVEQGCPLDLSVRILAPLDDGDPA